MRVNLTLCRWLLRRTSVVTWPAMLAAMLYVALKPMPWNWNDATPLLFVLVHALALMRLLGGAKPYLYTRGFDRDTLWLNLMLATVIAVLPVWLPAALIVWSPLRSIIQADLFHNGWYPLMRPEDAIWPWLWLAGYAVLMPAVHYAWIRRAQATRGGGGGDMLALAQIATVITVCLLGRAIAREPLLVWTVLSALMLSALFALTASWRQHRHMEVTS